MTERSGGAVDTDNVPDELKLPKNWTTKKFAEPWWHYADALIWIAFQNLVSFVEHLAPDSANIRPINLYKMNAGEVGFYVYHKIMEGQQIENLTPAIEIKAKFKPSVINSDPNDALNNALRSGHIVAGGILDGGGVFENIPANQWQYLELPPKRAFARAGLPTVDALCVHAVPDRDERGHWFDLRFDCESILKAFPAMISADQGSEANVVNARPVAQRPVELRDWLKTYLPTNQRPTQKTVQDKAVEMRWNQKWAVKEAGKIADELGLPRRLRGQKITPRRSKVASAK